MSENSSREPRSIVAPTSHPSEPPISASRESSRLRESSTDASGPHYTDSHYEQHHNSSWRDSLPNMLKQIETARSHIKPPPLQHRLSDAGKDAAAVRATMKPLGGSESAAVETVDEDSALEDDEEEEDQKESGKAQGWNEHARAFAEIQGASQKKREWSPSSWTQKPITQDVTYPSRSALERSLSQLELLPPLVTPHEIHNLKLHLRRVALGQAFLLQGGDCAELFSYCTPPVIDAKIKLLLQMSLVLIWGLHKPVIRLGRLAGQYAKPRSKPTEVGSDGVTRPSFRGDILNGYSEDERTPDPARLVSAYFHSATTLNHVRGQLAAGMADLHRPMDWGLGHVKDAGVRARYERIVKGITEALDFMRTVGAEGSGSGGGSGVLETVEVFTSHEGLVLEYEQSLTRYMRRPEGSDAASQEQKEADETSSASQHNWYATSAHFLWIGDRTRQLNGAHVEFFRGIANPIGIKVGPSMAAEELVRLLDIVDSKREAGKVTLITRYGASKVEECLGAHIDAVEKSDHTVVWMCDPMHGNTRSTPAGIKTRHFTDILSEVSSALRIHKQHGTFLGGVHLELTGEAVTECVGGSEGLVEEDLSLNYTTYCDPRLNEKQALELAFLIANDHRKHHRPHEHLG